jgi:hypothetical protein
MVFFGLGGENIIEALNLISVVQLSDPSDTIPSFSIAVIPYNIKLTFILQF